MKLEYFEITTKDNTTCYDTVAKHIAKTFCHHKLNGDKAIELDFVAQMEVMWTVGDEKHEVKVMSHDVSSLIEWLKENHPEVHVLIPPFRIDVFQELAEKMKSSSSLVYSAIHESAADPEDLRFEFGDDPDTDDFVPEKESVEESLHEIIKKGYYTCLQCYPHTPIGFWHFYGLDFESLFNHIIEEE